MFSCHTSGAMIEPKNSWFTRPERALGTECRVGGEVKTSDLICQKAVSVTFSAHHSRSSLGATALVR